MNTGIQRLPCRSTYQLSQYRPLPFNVPTVTISPLPLNEPCGCNCGFLDMMSDNDHNDENRPGESSQGWRWGRIAGILLLILVGLGLLIQLVFNFWAEPRLKEELQSAAASQHLATESGDWSISLLRRQFSANNLKLYQPDSLAVQPETRQPLDSLTVENITISGIEAFSYLFSNEINMSAVAINEPRIWGRHPDSFSGQQSGGEKDTSGSETLYQRIESFADAVEIGSFSINAFNAELDDDTTAEKQAVIHNLSLEFEEIRIDSTSPQRRYMPASTASGSLDSLRWELSSGLYEIRSDSLGFSSADSLFEARNLSLHPMLPKYEFSWEKGEETDRIDLDIAALDIMELDVITLFEDQSVEASAIHVQDTRLEIFHSMRPPEGKPEEKTFPHLQFRRLETPVAIDSVVVSNADITYGEHENLIPEPGLVSFENTHAVIHNLYNEAAPGDPPAITATARSEVMGAGDLQVDFNFPPSETGTHYIDGYVGSMPIESLNPVLKYLAFIEVTDGQLDSIDFEMELGPETSSGTLVMQYRNFNVEVIEFEDGGHERSAALKTFLADIVVNEENTPPLEEGNISFERAKDKGIFNYWWKSLLSGLKSSIAF